MSTPSGLAILQNIVVNSFMTELNALKPGNVSGHSEGHNMTVDDFVKSAEISSLILCDPSLSVGQRILESVQATSAAVSCNTNLGMLLLFAPLVRAAELGVSSLHLNLHTTLAGLDERDTACIFEAIRHANPGGLGDSKKYDIRKKPEHGLTLKKAMSEAKHRDMIARQYVTDFSDIFVLGLNCMIDFMTRWNSVHWAAVACYMQLMTTFPDSHISRKFGSQVAEQIKISAVPIAKMFQKKDNPEDAVEMLTEYDQLLKEKGINPGTSADLTAASILVYCIIESYL